MSKVNFDKLTEYLDSLEEKYRVPGNHIIVTKDNQVVYTHAAGHSDYAKTRPVTEDVLHDLYSCSKVVTMTVCMQLIGKGMLALEEPVSKYMPEFAHMMVADDWDPADFMHMPTQQSPMHPAENPILIRHLMSMTAGLSYNTTGEPIQELRAAAENHASTRETVKAIAKMPLLFEPGTHYAYSLGHDVMAAVVEVITGMTFHEYVMKKIMEPLGVTDAYYQLTEKEEARLFAQYSVDFATGELKEQQGNTFRLSDIYDSGGAGLTTTLAGYSAVLQALANDGVGANGAKILSREMIDLMRTPMLNEVQLEEFAPSAGPFGPFHQGYSYALGVRTLIDGSTSKSPVGEFGWDGAACAYALIDPETHVSIAYAQQTLGMIRAYTEIHPTIRDLVYEAIEA